MKTKKETTSRAQDAMDIFKNAIGPLVREIVEEILAEQEADRDSEIEDAVRTILEGARIEI